MRESIKTELTDHLIGCIADGVLTDDNQEDWHHHAFNESEYLVYYARCDKWLLEHDIDVFEGIRICQDYERDNFGEDAVRRYTDSEKLVNMLVYIYGEELIGEIGAETIEELSEALNE